MTLHFNGHPVEVPQDTSLLDAALHAGIRIPTLCHDPRLAPGATCRMCLVQVDGLPQPVPACSTPGKDGWNIETHTPDLMETRRTLLEWMATGYPADLINAFPEKPFHQLLREAGIHPAPAPATPAFIDRSHPHFIADMSRCITCFRCINICEQVQGLDVWHALGRGKSTRIVPNGPTLMESSCVSCGACEPCRRATPRDSYCRTRHARRPPRGRRRS